MELEYEMNQITLKTTLYLSLAVAALPAVAAAAEPGAVDSGAFAPAPFLDAVNPMTPTGPTLYMCGGKVSSGTPIAGNAAGGGNSGTITLSGIPAGSEIIHAALFWTVLTDSDEASNTGQDIVFAGEDISGTQIGFADGASPCFIQANTVAWKADVTPYVSGDGAYTVSGFPGGNEILGTHFTEGVTLNVLYDDGSSTLRQFVNYEGLVVSELPGDTVSQTISGFTADPVGPVEATWYPVIGNGQIGPEDLEFSGTGAGSPIDLSDDAVLDGGTQAFAAQTCSYTDSSAVECFWDDDMVDVSAAVGTGSISATMDYAIPLSGGDCHTFVAMQLLVTTDQADFDAFCDEGSGQVDALCPESGPLGGGSWRNHGEYVRCVAHAANDYLISENVYCDEVRSCIVNPRARSNVGKRGGRP
jgi:hypothetical protein